MEIKFTVESKELMAALSVASIVTPVSTPQTPSGFLFVLRGETCSVYARDQKHEARASFRVHDASGEGSFVVPAEYIKEFKFIGGLISFSYTETEGDTPTFKLSYRFGDGKGFVERNTVDPKTVFLFEKDIQKAQGTVPDVFPIKVLQFVLAQSKPYLPKSNSDSVEEQFKTVRIFGDADPTLAKANGYMFASNNIEAVYVQCSALLDKDLSAHIQHLSLIESFLSSSEGVVSVYTTNTKTYMVNEQGNVLGWPKHTAEHKKFNYIAKNDEIVVMTVPAAMAHQIKLIKAGLKPDSSNRIRIHFDPETSQFHFSNRDDVNNASSLPVASEPLTVSVTTEFSAFVNADNMLRLFDGIKGAEVEFRIKILPSLEGKGRDRCFFRTMDNFLLSDDGVVLGGIVEPIPEGAHICKVTRFAPSMD